MLGPTNGYAVAIGRVLWYDKEYGFGVLLSEGTTREQNLEYCNGMVRNRSTPAAAHTLSRARSRSAQHDWRLNSRTLCRAIVR